MSDDLLADYLPGHTRFQMDHFITNLNGVTRYGKYCQAMRELAGRRESLRSAEMDYAMLMIRREELGAWHPTHTFRRFARQKHCVRLQQLEDQIKATKRQFLDTHREARHFEDQVRILKGTLGELTAEDRERLERDMWTKRLALKATAEMVSRGTLSENTFEILATAPEEWRRGVLAETVVPDPVRKLFDANLRIAKDA